MKIPGNVSPVSSDGEYTCDYCKITFTSASTFKGHQHLYCPRLRVSGFAGDVHSQAERTRLLSEEEKAGRMLQMQGLPGVSPLFPGHPAVILAAPMISANGMNNVSLNMPTMIYQHIDTSSEQISPGLTNGVKPPTAHTSPQRDVTTSKDAPLDLSNKKPQPKDELSSPNIKTEPRSPFSGSSHDESGNIMDNSGDETEVKHEDENCSPKPAPTNKDTDSASPPRNVVNMNLLHAFQNGVVPINAVAYPHFLQMQAMRSAQAPLAHHGVSKCNDCNIVFYKYENYQVHKQHYCSGRRREDASDSDEDPRTGRVNEPPREVSPSKDDGVDAPPSTSGAMSGCKYYCSHCQIKFSSASTLKAHVEYYCTSGNRDQSKRDNSRRIDDNDTDGDGDSSECHICEMCDCRFATARLLKLHFCRGPSQTTRVIRCAYCDFVTQTEAKLSEHVKVHAPSKSYRCSICGYRGNTVRGMRMHGKVHQDDGIHYSDDNVITFEEPPLVPIQNSIITSRVDTVDYETELLRLKNEPYKRRRSRKSAERTETMPVPSKSPPASTKHVCKICEETYDDATSFFVHVQMHGLASMKAMEAMPQKCKQCDYIPVNQHDLIRHVHSLHTEKELPQIEEVERDDNRDSDTESERKDSNLFPVSIKQEPKGESDSEPDPADSDATFAKNDLTDSEPSPLREVENEVGKSEEIISDVDIEENGCSDEVDGDVTDESVEKKLSADEAITTNGVKSEESEVTPVTQHSSFSYSALPLYGLPISNPLMAQYMALQTFPGPVGPNDVTPELADPKYCRHCDISFNYLSSFLAHKKYYCSARSGEEMTSPTKA